MSHETNKNESCHTLTESFHTAQHRTVLAEEERHTFQWVTSHIQMSHVIHTNESWQIYIQMSHDTYMNESCHTLSESCHVAQHGSVLAVEERHACKWVMSHIQMSHDTYMNESCHTMTVSCHVAQHSTVSAEEERHTFQWVTSQIQMSHVIHTNESWHIYEWVMSHNDCVMSRSTARDSISSRGRCTSTKATALQHAAPAMFPGSRTKYMSHELCI